MRTTALILLLIAFLLRSASATHVVLRVSSCGEFALMSEEAPTCICADRGCGCERTASLAPRSPFNPMPWLGQRPILPKLPSLRAEAPPGEGVCCVDYVIAGGCSGQRTLPGGRWYPTPARTMTLSWNHTFALPASHAGCGSAQACSGAPPGFLASTILRM